MPDTLAYVVLPPEGDDELRVYVMSVPDGPPLALFGTAALIWMKAADGVEDVAAAVAEDVHRTRSEIVDAVEDYLKILVADGLLTGDRGPQSG